MEKMAIKVLTVSKLLFAIFACCLFVACTADNQDLHKKISEVKARKGRPIKPLPKFKPMPKYNYPKIAGRRDPFWAYQDQQAAKKKNQPDINAPNLVRAKQVLEKFKLKELKMVGILKQNGTVWGLVAAPDKVVYKVTIGNYIGRDYGRVIAIRSNEIRLLERYKDNNLWKKRDVKLYLDETNQKIISHKKLEVEEMVR